MRTSMKRLFFMAEQHKWRMVLSVFSAIASVAAGMVPYFIVQRSIIALLFPGAAVEALIGFAALAALFLILKTILFLVSTNLSHKAAFGILRNVRIQLAAKLMRLPMGYVLERDSGVIKKTMENDVEELERFLAHNIPETVSSAVVPVTVLIYLALVDFRLTLTLLVFVPPAVMFYLLMMRGSKEKMARYYEASDNMNAVVVEYVNGMKEIKAFNQSESSFSRFQRAIEDYRKYVLEWYKSAWPLMTAYFVLIGSTLVSVLPAGLYLMMKGSLTEPVLLLFLLIAMGFAAPFLKLAEFADSITLVVKAEQNVYAILSEQEMPAVSEGPELKDNTVSFQNVSFAYDGETMVLSQASFDVAEGQSTAIIGPSGSGKSTIAKLLCRFWDVNQGAIMVGGVDVRTIPPQVLMEKVSFVFQDTFLFNLSIADNIRIGKPDANKKEIVHAAKLARCHEFILNTPKGYDTLTGDAGSRLSGGERQRICIARAMLKNAPILVLDEATASIDPDSEEQIQEAIGALAKNKTLIVIAHRIRTIMNFEQILIMDGGRIAAAGTHEQLLKESPLYQRIYDAYSFTESWVLGREEALC